jgi:hypothetical protein
MNKEPVTITGMLTAYLTDYHLKQVTSEELFSPNGVKHLAFSQHQNMPGWTKVGMATITVEMESQDAVLNNAINALRAKQAEIRAEAAAKCTALDTQINNLLALENHA